MSEHPAECVCDRCIDAQVKAMVAPYVKEAYAEGRADERAAIVRWLRLRGYVTASETARQIEAGEHERLKPTNANRCHHCKRYFTTPQGLGQHFRHARRKPALCVWRR